MSAVSTLPGIRFDPVVERPDGALPRMDVCGFVGFAAAGPIDVPVMVEDPVRFRDVFGVDPVLARAADGTNVTGHLGRSVEAFFANGGKRAWIVRVARTKSDSQGSGASTNTFIVPGLLIPGDAGGGATGWRLGTVSSRSAGSWSDHHRVGARLAVRSSVCGAFADDHVVLAGGVDIVPFDVLRLVVAEGLSALVTVERTTRTTAGLLVTFQEEDRWLVDETVDLSTHVVGPAWMLTAGDPLPMGPLQPFFESTDSGSVRLVVEPGTPIDPSRPLAFEAAAPGGGLTLLWPGEEVFDPDAPDDEQARHAVGRSMLISPLSATWSSDPATAPTGPLIAERLRIDPMVAEGQAIRWTLTSVGTNRRHQRSLSLLPNDEDLFSRIADVPRTSGATSTVTDYARRPLSDLDAEVLQPRFPIAATSADSMLPLALSTTTVDPVLGPSPILSTPTDAPIRNGLGTYDAGLFVDPELAGLGSDTIEATAFHIAYVADRPRRLRGLHALLPIDEVSMVVVPDAVHTGWVDEELVPPAPLTAPVLSPPEPVGSDDGEDDCDAVELSWTSVAGADGYELIEAESVAFDAGISRQTRDTSMVVADLPDCSAARFYRVRATRGVELGPWSNVTAAYVPVEDFAPCSGPDIPVDLLEGEPPAAPDPSVVNWRSRTADEAEPWLELRAVHAALLRFAAARGDLFALLSVPDSFTAVDAGGYGRWLSGLGSDFDGSGAELLPAFLSGGVPTLNSGEAHLVRSAAMYHPWIITGIVGDDVGLVSHPPDGAMAGIFARRSLDRGPWIAPANVAISDVVGLHPNLGDDDRLTLFEASVNPILPDPRGFVVYGARTLSRSAGTGQVNVRRLLQLLRRLALREGRVDVFRPNDDLFRSLVRMRFERLLTDLFERGAFAGATVSEAFEVYVGDVVNPTQSTDAGRFVVEIRVAPSVPMEFIVVRLLLAAGSEPTVEGG